MARKSFCEVYIHLVWRTKYGRRILRGELELFVHKRMREIGHELELTPLAVGSAWDHVHSFYRWRPTLAIADVVRTIKSKTAIEWNNSLRDGQHTREILRWQVGYGAISTRRRDVRVVQNYIDTQKQRHRRKALWAPFEQVEFVETPPSADEANAYERDIAGGRPAGVDDADVCWAAARRCCGESEG